MALVRRAFTSICLSRQAFGVRAGLHLKQTNLSATSEPLPSCLPLALGFGFSYSDNSCSSSNREPVRVRFVLGCSAPMKPKDSPSGRGRKAPVHVWQAGRFGMATRWVSGLAAVLLFFFLAVGWAADLPIGFAE